MDDTDPAEERGNVKSLTNFPYYVESTLTNLLAVASLPSPLTERDFRSSEEFSQVCVKFSVLRLLQFYNIICMDDDFTVPGFYFQDLYRSIYY